MIITNNEKLRRIYYLLNPSPPHPCPAEIPTSHLSAHSRVHKRDLLFPGILTLKGLGITAALHMNSWSVLYKRHGLWDNGAGCGKELTLGESRLVPDGRNQLSLKGTHCPGSKLGGSHHVMCLPPSSFSPPPPPRDKHPQNVSCPLDFTRGLSYTSLWRFTRQG